MIPRECITGYPDLTQGGEESEEVSLRKGHQRINQVKMKNKKSIPSTGTNTCKGPEVGGKQKGGKDSWSTVSWRTGSGCTTQDPRDLGQD